MMRERRVAIITGAGQGIGKATAKALVEEGFAVAIAEVDEQAGEEAQEELRKLGEARFFQTDVAEEGEVARLMERVHAQFGQLDLLVNNAAIMCNKPVTELSVREWNTVLGVNLTGPFLCSKHAAPQLRKSRGSIVNISSTRALMSEPDTEAYSASKGGLNALTCALAISLGPEVRVNGISPGWIEVRDWKKQSARQVPVLSDADHRQHPVGRVGRPEDIAALVLFLASEKAGFVTGQNFVADGGMTRKMIYVE